MQKFGLDTLKTDKPTPLELEIAHEKATALGFAGDKLEKSLASYRGALQRGDSAVELDRLIDEIVAAVSQLIVQRELMGLVHDNLAWVLQTHDLPQQARVRLGAGGQP